MSLDITFYGKNGEHPVAVDCTQEFYERLAKSDLAEIGKSTKIKQKIEEEEVEIEAIELDAGKITNRQRLIDFFKEEIVEESRNMLKKLGDTPSKDEYEKHTYPLKILQEILENLENKKYCYLAKGAG